MDGENNSTLPEGIFSLLDTSVCLPPHSDELLTR
jgi:hypothetical protein